MMRNTYLVLVISLLPVYEIVSFRIPNPTLSRAVPSRYYRPILTVLAASKGFYTRRTTL